MRSKTERFILWLGDFVEDGTTGKPSVKRYGVALGATVLAGVMFGLGVVIGLAVIESEGQNKVDITRHAVEALTNVTLAFVAMVGGNYTLGKLIERRKPKEGDR